MTWARESGKPVVVERLDFRTKKARLREASDRHARKLSHFLPPPSRSKAGEAVTIRSFFIGPQLR